MSRPEPLTTTEEALQGIEYQLENIALELRALNVLRELQHAEKVGNQYFIARLTTAWANIVKEREGE